jgi:hypothetical protein
MMFTYIRFESGVKPSSASSTVFRARMSARPTGGLLARCTEIHHTAEILCLSLDLNSKYSTGNVVNSFIHATKILEISRY